MKKTFEIAGDVRDEIPNFSIENIEDAFLILRTTSGISITVRLEELTKFEEIDVEFINETNS
ncbi:hypothetical protein BU065_13425 [Staphylococcus succinus]|uniref:hypothetical protein n=1 Tax=Staphylococcus succinus TaxID=61015 RepID=UPI000E6805B6|nr:hypothetical protein [Staphylococcus succinus]MEB8209451.1 hypothetical protein [Staphylococcus succinus]RIN30286.1 hypothetical protein BU065_13425 [Staphylococcus succinus]